MKFEGNQTVLDYNSFDIQSANTLLNIINSQPADKLNQAKQTATKRHLFYCVLCKLKYFLFFNTLAASIPLSSGDILSKAQDQQHVL